MEGSQASQKGVTGLQLAIIFGAILGPLFLDFVIDFIGWNAHQDFYGLLTGIDATLTGIVGMIAFVRYYSRRNDTLLFIGTAFTSVALIDIVQLLIWTETLGFAVNSAHTSLPWSWLASQTVFSILMFLSWLTLRIEKFFGSAQLIGERVLYFFVGTLTFAILIFFLFVPLPPPPHGQFWGLTRPWELIPAALLGVSVIGFLFRGKWKENTAELCIITSLLLLSMAHVVFMARSFVLYDPLFYGALIVKQAANIAIIVGSLSSMYALFHQAEEGENALIRQNALLANAEDELKSALGITRKKERDLAEQLQVSQRSKAKDEAMLESIGDGLVVTDDDTRVVRVNPGFEKMLGWSAEEVSGKPVTAVMPMVDETGKLVPYEKRAHPVALFTGEKITTSMKYYYMRRDQSKFPVAITVTPIMLGDQIIGAIEIFRDVTKEKNIDEQKSSFVSVASHQLRTPLTTMNWYIELLLAGDAGKVNNDQKEYLQEIYRGSKRLVLLVNDLLNVSRIESGRMRIQPVPIDVTALIRDTVKEVFPLTKGTKCLLKIEAPKNTLPLVPLDQNLYRQVIHNVLTNAIRYSPQNRRSEVTVHIAKRTVRRGTKNPHLRSGSYLLVSIEDHGIGIPKEAQARVYEKFYRAENALHASPEGSGLGLYLVQIIIDLSGGKMWFDTEVGKGTTFYIAYPLTGMKKLSGEKGLAQLD